MNYNDDRYVPLIEYVLRKRIVPLVEHQREFIMREENFTHSYMDEYKIDSVDGARSIRPVFDISYLDFIIIGLFVNEMNNEECKKIFNLNRKPMDFSILLLFIQAYFKDNTVLFKIPGKDENGENILYAFFGKLIIDKESIKQKLNRYINKINNPLE